MYYCSISGAQEVSANVEGKVAVKSSGRWQLIYFLGVKVPMSLVLEWWWAEIYFYPKPEVNEIFFEKVTYRIEMGGSGFPSASLLWGA